MAIGRAKKRRTVGNYELFYELSQSYLGTLWIAKVTAGPGAGLAATLRTISLEGLGTDAVNRLTEAARRSLESTPEGTLPVADVVVTASELSVVSDCLEAETLRAIHGLSSLRRKPIEVGIALRIGEDILQALSDAHRAIGQGAAVSYGGIGPDSVLLDVDGRTWLTDVEIAGAACRIESFASHPERVSYAAPEQIEATGTADPRTDLFIVGIILWEMLGNRRLFIGSDQAVAQKVLAAKIPRLDEVKRRGDFPISGAVIEFVARALERDPGARFQSADEMLEALRSTGEPAASREAVGEFVRAIDDSALERRREAIRDATGGKQPARLTAHLKRSQNVKSKGGPAPAIETNQRAPERAVTPKSAAHPSAARATAAVAEQPAAQAEAPAPIKPPIEPSPAAVPGPSGSASPRDPSRDARPMLKKTQIGMPSSMMREAATRGSSVRRTIPKKSLDSPPPRPRMPTMIGIPPPAPGSGPTAQNRPAASVAARAAPRARTASVEQAAPARPIEAAGDPPPRRIELPNPAAGVVRTEMRRIERPEAPPAAETRPAPPVDAPPAPAAATVPSQAELHDDPTIPTDAVLKAALARETDEELDERSDLFPVSAMEPVGAVLARTPKLDPALLLQPVPNPVMRAADVGVEGPPSPPSEPPPKTEPVPATNAQPSAPATVPTGAGAPGSAAATAEPPHHPASLFPSKIPPPLIHDPRAQRAHDSTRRSVKSRLPVPLLALIGAAAVVASAIALGVAVTRREPAPPPPEPMVPVAAIETAAPPQAPSPEPPPTADEPKEPESTAAEEPAPALSAAAEAAPDAAPKARAEEPKPPTPRSAPAPRRRPAPKPKPKPQKRFIPDDI